MKKPQWIIAIVTLLVIVFLIFICKPYIRQEKIYVNNTEVLINTNLITNKVFLFDSITLKWYSKNKYLKLLEKRVEDEYESLKISNYDDLLTIIDGANNKYSFLSKKQLLPFKHKIQTLNDMQNWEEIQSSRYELISNMNSLIENKKIEQIQRFKN